MLILQSWTMEHIQLQECLDVVTLHLFSLVLKMTTICN